MSVTPFATTIDTLQPVELADGVEIHLRVAGPAVRSVAWLVDLLIFAGILLLWGVVVAFIASAVGEGIGSGLFLLGLFLVAWFYNVVFEMTARAATPGQRVMKIKVVSVSGAPLRLPQSLIRNLLRVIDFMPAAYLFGLICCLFTSRFQRLGDLVADTVVIYDDSKPVEPSAIQVNAEPHPPPQVLNRAEQAAILQFLERAPHWSDARKMELSDLLEPLTDRKGLGGLTRVCSMGLWLQKGGKK
ncbi:MAG: RDD family protein [Verrucomicrobiota bacterium]